VIRLSRFDGSTFYLNAEHIQAVESTPDTHILLTNGQRYVVREPADEVAAAVIRYQRKVHQPWLGGLTAWQGGPDRRS
jgi:flagellar protein FlbD